MPQRAVHGLMGAHAPVESSQYWPDGQLTPLHGAGKHPGTQRPRKHVSRLLQRTPAQRSRAGTHASLTQRWPSGQRSRGERVHGGSQVHVSTQRPSTQSAPGAHVTPAQGLGMQRPSAQICVAAHITPSQLERGRHCTWQA